MRSWNILSVDLLTVAQGHYWYPHTSPTQIHTPWPAPCVGPKGGNCKWLRVASSVHFNSVTQSCSTLCDPMDCSSPGFPVHYQLQSLLKLMSIELVMPSNNLILCRPLLLLPSIFPRSGSFPVSLFFVSGDQGIGVSASASVLPMNIQNRFSLRLTGWISFQSKGLSRVFSNTTVQKHHFFSAQLSL